MTFTKPATNISYEQLQAEYPPRKIPSSPYIGLFGNHHNIWRHCVQRRLLELGMTPSQIYLSTDHGWEMIDSKNGDARQAWVNELVRRQHVAMKNANCLIFSLGECSGDTCRHSKSKTSDKRVEESASMYAARCELGWLGATGKRTFVWISDEVEGRNYLRAVVRLCDSLTEVSSLEKGCQSAFSYMNNFTIHN